MNKEKRHVGRPTNEEVRKRKIKKTIKVVIPVILMVMLLSTLFLSVNKESIITSSRLKGVATDVYKNTTYEKVSTLNSAIVVHSGDKLIDTNCNFNVSIEVNSLNKESYSKIKVTGIKLLYKKDGKEQFAISSINNSFALGEGKNYKTVSYPGDIVNYGSLKLAIYFTHDNGDGTTDHNYVYDDITTSKSLKQQYSNCITTTTAANNNNNNSNNSNNSNNNSNNTGSSGGSDDYTPPTGTTKKVDTLTTTASNQGTAAEDAEFEFTTGNSEFDCSGLEELMDTVWKIILIGGPALTLIMTIIEFTKPIVSSDPDALKKASSNTIKRTIALVLLMALKVIINALLSFFGLDSCV